tara:strand:+ start:331 stop:633 length:303 start_codon:yes stop_codon:yes gene_type:complete
MESNSFTGQQSYKFCRIIFADSWRSFSQGDHFDTVNPDDVSVLPGDPDMINVHDMYFVQRLGYVPKGVVKEVQIVEKTVTTVTTETFKVVDTMYWPAECT